MVYGENEVKTMNHWNAVIIAGLIVALTALHARNIYTQRQDIEQIEAISKKVQSVNEGMQPLVNAALNNGMKLGYLVHAYGGNAEDVLTLLGAMQSNRMDVVNGWLNTHKPIEERVEK